MSQNTLLSLGVLGLTILAGFALLYVWQRRRPVNDPAMSVRFLGAYSPLLSWLKQRRSRNTDKPGAAPQPGGTHAAASQPNAGLAVQPVGSNLSSRSLWDWLKDLPAVIRPRIAERLLWLSERAKTIVSIAPAFAGSVPTRPVDLNRQAEGETPHAPLVASEATVTEATDSDTEPLTAPAADEPALAVSSADPLDPGSRSTADQTPPVPDVPLGPAAPLITPATDGASVRVVLEIPVGASVQIMVETSAVTDGEIGQSGPAATVRIVPLPEAEARPAAALRAPDSQHPIQTAEIEAVAVPMAVDTAAPAATAVFQPTLADSRLAGIARNGWKRLTERVKALPLVATISVLALVLYLITRLWGIDRFPLFFYSDEANYVIFANQLVAHGFQGSDGQVLPLYFEVDNHRWAPEIEIYLQLVTSALLGNSIFVARATNAVISLLCVVAAGLTLKWVFEARFWWAVVLILGVVPAYFLYSRVAFEMIVMASFYAAFLLFYLLYRTRSPRYLYLTLVAGAATFYAYSAAQPMMLLVGILLLLSDLRYHIANWRTALKALPLALLLVVPAARFSLAHPGGITEHLNSIGSYWVADKPLAEKASIFLHDYAYALSPQYWFLPNPVEDSVLPNQHLPGQANFGLVWLPFVLIGLWICLRRVRDPRHRALLLAALAVPMGAVFDSVEIRRMLAMLVPLGLFVGLGLEWLMAWLTARFPRFTFKQQTWSVFAVLAAANIWLLVSALVVIPKQYDDYTLEGVQFGVKQIFEDTLPKYLRADPALRVLVSPVWANNTQVFPAFFYSPADQQRVNMGVIFDYLREKRDLNDVLMVMTSQEYDQAHTSPELKSLAVEQTLYYPNGQPSFYVTRPVYADNIDALIAAQKAERQKPLQTQLDLYGQTVTVTYSVLGSGDISAAFDGSPASLVRGLEANPFILGLTFPKPRAIHGAALTLGSMDDLTLKVILTPPSGAPVIIQQNYRGLPADPTVDLTFANGPPLVADIRFEITNNLSGDVAQTHVRELVLR